MITLHEFLVENAEKYNLVDMASHLERLKDYLHFSVISIHVYNPPVEDVYPAMDFNLDSQEAKVYEVPRDLVN